MSIGDGSGVLGYSGSSAPTPTGTHTLVAHGVPFEITPAMVATATGPISISPRVSILFDDTTYTTANGPLAVRVKSIGIRKLARTEAHVSPPAVPAAGPYFTAVSTITGSRFVGGTISLGNGRLSAGTVTNRRLLRHGVPVSFTGSSYTLTSEDLDMTFIFEVTGTSGGIVIGPERVWQSGTWLHLPMQDGAGVVWNVQGIPPQAGDDGWSIVERDDVRYASLAHQGGRPMPFLPIPIHLPPSRAARFTTTAGGGNGEQQRPTANSFSAGIEHIHEGRNIRIGHGGEVPALHDHRHRRCSSLLCKASAVIAAIHDRAQSRACRWLARCCRL